MAAHDGHFNHQYLPDPPVPAGTGDRFYSQDMARDFQYLRDLGARLVSDVLEEGSPLLSGGAVAEGSTKALISVSAAVGLCDLDVTVPDDSEPWAVPAARATRQVKVRVSCPSLADLPLAALGATLDGHSVNYLKLRHSELSAQSRVRQYARSSYPYAKRDSYSLHCDVAAPTGYDVVLAELLGDGASVLEVSQYSPRRVGTGIVEGGLSDDLGEYFLMGNGARLREGAGVVSEANGQLTLGSGQVLQADDVQEVTGNATVGVYTRSVLVTTAAAVTITIPAGCAIGHEIKIMRTVASANAITVARSGSELIEGAATFVTHGSWEASTLNLAEVVLKKIDATNWRFVGGEVSGSNANGFYVKRPNGDMRQHRTFSGAASLAYTQFPLPIPFALRGGVVYTSYELYGSLRPNANVGYVIFWVTDLANGTYYQTGPANNTLSWAADGRWRA